MQRRMFMIGSVTGALGFPRAVRGQQPSKVPRVGFLAMGHQHPAFAVFVDALATLGWVSGRTIALEPRFADIGRPEQFDHLAADLVRRRVEVIVALIHPEIIAAQRATSTIPIVMVIGVDPVGHGFARSLARPGGNITGLAWDADPEFNAKSVEILGEIVPRLRRIGGIVDPAFRAMTSQEAAQRGASRHGVQLNAVDVRAPDELDTVFARMLA